MTEPVNPPPETQVVEDCLERYTKEKHAIRLFGDSVRGFFADHPKLTSGDLPTVHSVKSRMKDDEHLREKIVRKKVEDNRDITADTLLAQVTDLYGVRVLHLHSEQFRPIYAAIRTHIEAGHWHPFEPPKAYTWDPEAQAFFTELGIETFLRESHYTSVHFVVKPNEDSSLTCEIQVRTLFEEVWGEIDHLINYPMATESIACREQLAVLAKMVGAGSRLADAIFRSHGEYLKSQATS